MSAAAWWSRPPATRNLDVRPPLVRPSRRPRVSPQPPFEHPASWPCGAHSDAWHRSSTCHGPALRQQGPSASTRTPSAAPAEPTTVEGLRRPVGGRSIAPPQAISVHKDHATRHPAVFDPRPPPGLRKERVKRRGCSSVSQRKLLMLPCISEVTRVTDRRPRPAASWVLTVNSPKAYRGRMIGLALGGLLLVIAMA